MELEGGWYKNPGKTIVPLQPAVLQYNNFNKQTIDFKFMKIFPFLRHDHIVIGGRFNLYIHLGTGKSKGKIYSIETIIFEWGARDLYS